MFFFSRPRLKYNLLFFTLIVSTCWIIACPSQEKKNREAFERGKQHFEQGEYLEASRIFHDLADRSFDHIEVYLKLAQSYLKLGKTKDAFKTYQRAAKIAPDHPQILLKLAHFNVLEKNTAQALISLDELLRKHPDHPQALMMRAEVLFSERKFHPAKETLQQIIRIDPGQTNAIMLLAKISAIQGDAKAVETLLKKAIQSAPDSLPPRLTLFRYLLSRKKVDEAEAEIAKAIQQHPTNAELYLILGNYHFSRHRRIQAEAAFKKAVEHASDRTKPFLVLAEYYDTVGKTDQAAHVYETCLKKHPNDFRLRLRMSEFLLRNQRLEQSAQHIQHILALRPDYLPAKFLLAELKTLQESYDEVLGLADDIIARAPQSYHAYYYKGVAHWGKKETLQAIQHLQHSLEINPLYVNAKMLLSEVYLYQEEFELAKKEHQELIAILHQPLQIPILLGYPVAITPPKEKVEATSQQPFKHFNESSSAYLRTAVIENLRKRYHRLNAALSRIIENDPEKIDVFTIVILQHAARREFNKAIKKCEEHLNKIRGKRDLEAQVYHLKGGLHLIQKQYDLAEKSFLKAIRLQPAAIQPYHSVARLYMISGHYEKSIDKYQTIINTQEKAAWAHMVLATIHELKGNMIQSERHLRKTLELDPQFAPGANGLAMILADRNVNIDEALELVELALSKLPEDPNILDTLGWIYYRLGKYQEAVDQFIPSLRKHPENPVTHYHLGMAYYRLGEKSKALQELRRALLLNQKYYNEKFNGADEARATIAAIEGQPPS